MFLKEFEGRELFAKQGIPVARGVLLDSKADWNEKLSKFVGETKDVSEFVIKAQLLRGKRGKSGGVQFAGVDELTDMVGDFFGKEIGGEVVNQVFVQEKVDVKQELYLGVTIDRFRRCPVLIFSGEGGIEIEEVAARDPGKISEVCFVDELTLEEEVVAGFLERAGLDLGLSGELLSISQKLLELFVQEDAILVEINPLMLTNEGSLLAVDAKFVIDNNALREHPEFAEKFGRGYSQLELDAREHGLSYVELDGDVAIIGNGAGLVMATLDAVNEHGGRSANFCDVGGGASAEMMQKALEIVLKKESVKKLFINIFGGITHCDLIAAGIVEYMKENKIKMPMVVRIEGTNADKAREMLEKDGITALTSFDEAARKAANL